jgi:CubicO group peptidase (beta-lactamase class C family)
MIESLREYVAELAMRDQFSGAVLIAGPGEREPLFIRSYGLASRAFQVPNRVDTKFNLGSMNKMFTAVAVAQLVEHGRLAFDDPISAHLPDYPREDIARRVTVHHLLTHTSGLGDYVNERYWTMRDSISTVNDYLALFSADSLLFAPGARAQYSNAGFIVLGAIIERISGQSYDDFVRDNIYDLAGMRDTGAYALDRDTPNLAVGYTHKAPDGSSKPDEYWNNLLALPRRGGPAGGGYSTVGDLLRFARELLRHTLLSPTMTATIMQPKVELTTRAFSQYGYGFGVERIGQATIVGHTGGAPGVSAQLDIYTNTGYCVIALANADPSAATHFARRAREILTSDAQ